MIYDSRILRGIHENAPVIAEIKSTLRLLVWISSANSAGIAALIGFAVRGH